MSEEEIKSALSIEARECGNMCSDWIEIDLMWNGEVISTATFNEVSHDD